MLQVYDVMIVGAGPGGATAAYELSRTGMNVLVLEKEQIPRYKTCGGGVSPRMLQKLFPFSFDPVIENHIKSMTYTFRNKSVSAKIPMMSACTVMRDGFDSFLLSQSTATVLSDLRVTQVKELDDYVALETKSGQTFRGRYCIAADGANSIVARELGLRKKKVLAGAIEAEVDVTPDVISRFSDKMLFIFGEIHRGYAWIFPKKTSLSIGVAGFRPKPGELQAVLRKVFSQFQLPTETAVIHGHPIPIYTRNDRVATDRILLVGDAAGLVDPLSGEGIRLAIKSGYLAAKAIINGQPKSYQKMIRKEIGVNLLWGLGLAQLFYTFPFFCFWLGAANPLSTQAFGDLLSDDANYPEVVLRIFGTLPVFLFIEFIASIIRLFGGQISSENFRKNVYSIFE